MLHSQVVEMNGTFVGAAITTQGGFRFRAVHLNVEELDESTWRSLDELRKAVWCLFTTARLSAGQTSAVIEPSQMVESPRLPASAPEAADVVQILPIPSD